MNAPRIPVERASLEAAATAAALHAYAPYSRFRVGAAVDTELGVITGCNVENASYGLCLCAERNALAAAIARGARQFRALAVACPDADPALGLHGRMPCGACRQWLQELAPTATIFIVGSERLFTPADLLPDAFALPQTSGPIADAR